MPLLCKPYPECPTFCCCWSLSAEVCPSTRVLVGNSSVLHTLGPALCVCLSLRAPSLPLFPAAFSQPGWCCDILSMSLNLCGNLGRECSSSWAALTCPCYLWFLRARTLCGILHAAIIFFPSACCSSDPWLAGCWPGQFSACWWLPCLNTVLSRRAVWW